MSRKVRVWMSLSLLLVSLPLAAANDPREQEELVATAERIGRLHNEMLDAVAASGLPAKGDMNAMLELMGRQLTEKLGGTIDLREASQLVEACRDAAVVERALDARQQQLLKVLLQQIETSPDAAVTIRRLRAFETALLRRNDLTLEEKRPLLVAAVVGRYSAEYWHEAAMNPKSPWYGDDPIEMPKWVGADLAGALLAMESLAGLGAVCPPCYVGAVVVVAAGASIAAALA